MSKKSAPNAPSDATYDTLARRSLSSGIMHAVLATIVGFSTTYVSERPTLGRAVISGVVALGLARFALSLSYARVERALPKGSALLFRWTTLLAGAYWGIAAGAAMSRAFDIDALLVLVTTAGIAAGSTTTLSPDLRLARTFLLLLLGPLIVACALGGTSQSHGTTLVSLLFLCFLEVQVGRLHREYVAGVEQSLMLAQRAESLEEARERAEAAQHEAAAASRAKSDFLANMSHELRTPMTSVIGYSEQLLAPDVDAEERIAFAEIIRKNGEHLLELINDILDLSKIEAGKMTVEPLSCSLSSILADVESLMRPRAIEKQLAFAAVLETPIPATIHSDPLRVRQIIVNLVGNALKFTETGKVEIRVRLDREGPEPRVHIAIRDTGIGLTEEQMSHLFRPFVQVDSSAKRRFQGTGLGLDISQRFARLLGGEIRVQSLFGVGSVFTLELPTGSLDGELCTSLTVARERPEQSIVIPELLSGICVLLAEDYIDNERLITALLRKGGARVEVARDGQSAVQLATAAASAGAPFDVILMDMQMPILDGYGATAQLRSLGYRGPIVALTANAMAGDRERCLAAGCDAHLPKPIRRMELVELVAQMADAGREALSAMPRESALISTRLARAPAVSRSKRAQAALRDDTPIYSTLLDDPIVLELLEQFMDDLEQKLARLQALTAPQLDLPELQRLSHAMAGAGGSYGFDVLTETARDLERSARDGDAEAARAHAATLIGLCKRVLAGRGAPPAPGFPRALEG